MTKLFTTIMALGTLAAGAQNNARIGMSDMKAKMAIRQQMTINKDRVASTKGKVKSATAVPLSLQAGKLSSVTSFTSFSSSSNIYGVTLNTLKPLQYNDNVNVVSFIQRRGDNYPAQPYNNTGVITAMISSNWGASWDSTCIYSSNSEFGRYPQGAVYNPIGNTSVGNAYVIGCGPVIDGGGSWAGNFYASKQLSAFTTTASQVANAQQFFDTNGPFGPNVFSNDWPTYGFASTDDGVVRSLGQLTYDPDAAPIDARGAVIQKGIFNAGVFSWSTDSLLPPVVITSNATTQMSQNGLMAWNEAGTVGYVIFIGSRTGQTLSNTGWQPIVYKTTNSGASWNIIPGIDFNSTAFQYIKNRLDHVNGNSSLQIPMFDPFEGIDAAVDANNKLHIVSVIATTASSHLDSLAYTPEYGLEQYTWAHTPGRHPYLYDFIGDGTSAWTFLVVDSLSSEAPGSTSGYPGFNDNPWDDDAGKVTSDARVQLSRSPNGQSIIYTYAESDTNFTNAAKKWNTLPNVKGRMWNNINPALSLNEINITKPAVGQNPNVANKAMFHFTSINSSDPLILTTTSAQVKMPLTVTNSNPYIQGSSNTHYYSTETLTFTFPPTAGIKENQTATASQFDVYPNPASQKCTVLVQLTDAADLNVSVTNYLGQVVKQQNYKAQQGMNEVNVDLTSVKTGIYFVTVKNGTNVSTKKLVVE